MCSSGDSTGVNPVDQKKLYDDAVAKKPSTILSLEHEVYGMFLSPFPFPFLFFFINAAFIFLSFCFFSRYQRVNICSISSLFFLWG